MKDDIEVWVDEADSVMKAIEEMEEFGEYMEIDSTIWINLSVDDKPWLED